MHRGCEVLKLPETGPRELMRYQGLQASLAGGGLLLLGTHGE